MKNSSKVVIYDSFGPYPAIKKGSVVARTSARNQVVAKTSAGIRMCVS